MLLCTRDALLPWPTYRLKTCKCVVMFLCETCVTDVRSWHGLKGLHFSYFARSSTRPVCMLYMIWPSLSGNVGSTLRFARIFPCASGLPWQLDRAFHSCFVTTYTHFMSLCLWNSSNIETLYLSCCLLTFHLLWVTLFFLKVP